MQIRLTLLLAHLEASEWKGLPHNVGLKTALLAKERGYIEGLAEFPHQGYRLTEAGTAARSGLVA